MTRLRNAMGSFVRSEDGPTTTEYAVMIAIIAVAAIASMSSFGDRVGNIYVALASAVDVF